MIESDQDTIINDFRRFIGGARYPCVAGRAAVMRGHVPVYVAEHLACPNNDRNILDFIYTFINNYRLSTATLHSAAVIFKGPKKVPEKLFDELLWQRLQALSQMDAQRFSYDKRVSQDPHSANFSFSLGEEALFIIALHPDSGRRSRKFDYPAIVFNPHAQFEQMRNAGQYEKLKEIVRKRDIAYSGSINPMLADFGDASEAYQYSGRHYTSEWTCPLKVIHGIRENHSTEE